MIVGNIRKKIKLKMTQQQLHGDICKDRNGPLWMILHTLSATKDPSIMYYGGAFYIFGKDFKTFYKSEAGIVWKEVTNMFMFPIDQNH